MRLICKRLVDWLLPSEARGALVARPWQGKSPALVVHVALGDRLPRSGRGDACLSPELCERRLVEVVRFASQRNLPIDAWAIWHPHRLPHRVDRVARWLAAVARAAPENQVMLVTDGVPPAYLRRLLGHLRRLNALS